MLGEEGIEAKLTGAKLAMRKVVSAEDGKEAKSGGFYGPKAKLSGGKLLVARNTR